MSDQSHPTRREQEWYEMAARAPVIELIDPKVVEILRRKTPAERLAQAFRMWQTARRVTQVSIRQQHPEWNSDQIDRETANRLSRGVTERVRQ